MTLSATDYALLAQDAYQTRENNSKVELGGVDYRVLDHMNDPVTGYQGTAYQRLDTGEVVIAHRGTEQVLQDGVVADAGMVLTGVNVQMGDAMTFSRRVIAEATQAAEQGHYPLNVTVTGHSLGGTLAEATAYKLGLQGQTFNAYGAAGLLEDIPKGGNQVIDNVRATDAVSAASAHFGEVRVYAVPQDIDKLNKAGYHDGGSVLSPRDPVGVAATSLSAHAIDNFVPNSKTLGQSIMTPQNQALYQAHEGMIDRYRTDVQDTRKVLSAGWEIPKAIVEGAESLEHAVAQKATQIYDSVRDAAERVGHDISQAAHNVVDRVESAVDAVRKDISDKLHPAAPTPRLDQPAHPDHALFEQALRGVQRIDAQHGRTPDQNSQNLAAALTVAARQDGLERIDHVVLSDDRSRAFAVQGGLDSPLKRIADVGTQQAVGTSIEQSGQALQKLDQQRAPTEAAPQQAAAMRMG
jgi:hypothetical protein